MKFMRTAAATVLLILLPLLSIAQAFPVKPFTWVVPYPAGGPADVIARAIAPRMSRELGQTIVIENVPGVGGALAGMRVLNGPSDGYTLFQGSPNEVILAALANKAVTIKLTDFTLVSPFTVNPLVLLVRKDFPANSIDEVAVAARNSSTALNYGSVGAGSMFHLAAEDFGGRVNGKLLHVPYKGGAPLLQDLGVGSIDFALLPFTSTYTGLADAGRLKILGVAAPQRLSVLKGVPSFDESRLLRGFHYGAWAGLMVKRGTPTAVVDRLHGALGKTLADPEVRRTLEATGSQVHELLSIRESDKFLQSEARRYRELALRVGVKPE